MKRKSLLRSCFAYEQTMPAEVLALFKQMAVNPEKVVKNVDEIINNAFSGRIDFTRDFNLYGYDYIVGKKQKLSTYSDDTKRNKDCEDRCKCVYINFNAPEEETSRDSSLIHESEVVSKATAFGGLKDAFESIAEDSELAYAVNTIMELREDFLITDNVDIVVLIKQAVKGIPKAVKKLRSICEEYELVGEQVKVILTSKVDVSTCFAL